MHFRKKKGVNVEEQRAQKDDRFFRGTQIVYMIYEHFHAGAAYKMTTSKISKYDGIKLYYQQAKFLQKDPARFFFKFKLLDSVQHQTVLALYDRKTVRSNKPPSYSRLETIVRRHIDRTTRTRKFRARNGIVEGGAVTRVKKGEIDGESPQQLLLQVLLVRGPTPEHLYRQARRLVFNCG